MSKSIGFSIQYVVIVTQYFHNLGNGSTHTNRIKNTYQSDTLQVRIQDLVRGGGPASEAESCRCSEAELCKRSKQSVAGVQDPLKGPGSFWVFNAQICILTHSRDSFFLIFDIYFDTKC